MDVAAISRVAFYIGDFPVFWYGVIIGSGALIAAVLAFYEAKKIGFDLDTLLNTLIIAIPVAVISARLYFVAFHWDYYGQNLGQILAIRDGGLAIHGVLVGGLLAAFFYARAKGFSFLLLAEIVVPSILLGQAIGRWGNFTNQEAHGGPVSLEFLENLRLPQFIIDQMQIGGIYYHPTFLYESIWSIIGVAILLLIRYRNPIRGVIMSLYFIWYSIGRFYIEGLRTDSLTMNGPDWLAKLLDALWAPFALVFEAGAMEGGNIRSAQLFSVLAILFFAGYLVYISRQPRSLLRYADQPYVVGIGNVEADLAGELAETVDSELASGVTEEETSDEEDESL